LTGLAITILEEEKPFHENLRVPTPGACQVRLCDFSIEGLAEALWTVL
jgi:hypothetical protein